MPKSKKLGNRIRRTRETYGWSRKDLADYTGFSKSSIQWYENGGEPTASRILVLAEVFGVSLRWLITGRKAKGKAA